MITKQLHDVPVGSKVKIIRPKHYLGTPPASFNIKEDEVLTYTFKDGMYACCTDKEGNKLQVAGWTEVEIIEERLADSE